MGVYFMKSNYLFIFIGIIIFLSIGFGNAVNCNTTNNIINSTSISNGCSLTSPNNVYTMLGETFNLNSSNSGNAIIIDGNNITLNCNGSTIYGNFSKTSFSFSGMV